MYVSVNQPSSFHCKTTPQKRKSNHFKHFKPIIIIQEEFHISNQIIVNEYPVQYKKKNNQIVNISTNIWTIRLNNDNDMSCHSTSKGDPLRRPEARIRKPELVLLFHAVQLGSRTTMAHVG